MQQTLTFTKDELAVWTWLVSRGISNALSGLSQMVGHEIRVNSVTLKQFPVREAANLMGGPEEIVVGIYLAIHGDTDGHLMLVHKPKIAFELVDMQMGLPPGTTKSLEEMERSVLGEMGNITGSYFLSSLADASGMILMPSPPTVMIDMAGAIMEIALTRILQEQDDVFVVKTTFGTDTQQIDGSFMVLPTMEFMRAILKHAGAK